MEKSRTYKELIMNLLDIPETPFRKFTNPWELALRPFAVLPHITLYSIYSVDRVMVAFFVLKIKHKHDNKNLK